MENIKKETNYHIWNFKTILIKNMGKEHMYSVKYYKK